MNIGNYNKTFNNDTYETLFYMYNGNISLTAPDTISNDDNVSLIPSELVLYYMVENSMTCFVPSASFEIIDDHHSITNKLKGQNTRIGVNISKNAGSDRLSMFLTYIVKDYKIKEITPESVTYRIYADLDNSVPLNTLCEYATTCSLEIDNEMMENPYEISKSILQQVGYKLYPTEKRNEEGIKMATKYSLPYTNEVCHFITYPNMKALDALRYLFSYAIGENGVSTPAYLVHNLYDDKGYITTCEDIWKPTSIEEQPKNTKVPFSITKSPTPSRQYLMTDITTGIDAGGIEFARIFFNYRFFEYDQETREWENYHINKITIDDLVTKGINHGSQVSLYLKMLKEDMEQSRYYAYAPHNHPLFYDVLKQLELYSSDLMFTVDGDLRLDVGQVINVYERGANDSKIEQFNGQWMIAKIQHSFRNKEYKCHLICSRRFNTRLEKK